MLCSVGGILGGILGAVFFILAVLFIVGFVAFYIIIKRNKILGDPDKNAASDDGLFGALMLPSGKELHKYMEEKKKLWRALPAETAVVKTTDGLTLKGLYYKTDKEPQGAILCLHGYNSTGAGDFAAIGRFYLDNGYNVLTATHRAHGESEGKYIGFGALDRYDVAAWLKWLNDNYPGQDIFIHGMSMGAATAMLSTALPYPQNVLGVIEDCGYLTPRAVFSAQCRKLFHLPEFPLVDLIGMYTKIFAGYSIEQSSAEAVAQSKVPMLFIHGAADNFISPQMCNDCYQACKTYKQILLVEGAGHAASFFTNPELYGKTVLDFIAHAKEIKEEVKEEIY